MNEHQKDKHGQPQKEQLKTIGFTNIIQSKRTPIFVMSIQKDPRKLRYFCAIIWLVLSEHLRVFVVVLFLFENRERPRSFLSLPSSSNSHHFYGQKMGNDSSHERGTLNLHWMHDEWFASIVLHLKRSPLKMANLDRIRNARHSGQFWFRPLLYE